MNARPESEIISGSGFLFSGVVCGARKGSMKVSVQVSLKRAFAAGINCKAEEILDLDPAQLPEDVCAVVALRLCVQHKHEGTDARLDSHGSCSGLGALAAPTVEALISRARDIIAEEKLAAEKLAAQYAVNETKALAFLARYEERPLDALDGATSAKTEEYGNWFRGYSSWHNPIEDSAILARVAAVLYTIDTESTRRTTENKQRAEAEDAARKEAALRERNDWIAAHGSPRLRGMLKHGIECDAVYRDERLASERPGWNWESPEGDDEAPRNVPQAALDLLDECAEVAPDAWLDYRVIESTEDEDGNDVGDGWRGYVVKASHLGRTIEFARAIPQTPCAC